MHGQSQNYVPETMPAGYKMRRHQTEIAVLAVFKRQASLQLAVQDDFSDSSSSALAFLLRFASINEKPMASVFSRAEKVKFLREMAWALEAYQYAREQEADVEDEESS